MTLTLFLMVVGGFLLSTIIWGTGILVRKQTMEDATTNRDAFDTEAYINIGLIFICLVGVLLELAGLLHLYRLGVF